MNWIDISVPLYNGMVRWPDDQPFLRAETLKIANGDPCNLSEISTSAHVGTHMDAPIHFLADGAGMDARVDLRARAGVHGRRCRSASY